MIRNTLLLVALCASLLSFSQANQLSDAEKKAGWKLLFDGTSLKGWRPYQNAPADCWEVVNGEIVSRSAGVTRRADLITVDQYDNFELSFDWRVAKGANSGVIYRVVETTRPSFESGPEYQLIDDNGYSEKLEDWQKSGADYAMHKPTSLTAKPAGEYNTSRIVVNNGHVEHWLNGVKVADFELWTPEWEKLKSESKWKDSKDYGMARKGHIALQDHGGGVWFRNIKLRKL